LGIISVSDVATFDSQDNGVEISEERMETPSGVQHVEDMGTDSGTRDASEKVQLFSQTNLKFLKKLD